MKPAYGLSRLLSISLAGQPIAIVASRETAARLGAGAKEREVAVMSDTERAYRYPTQTDCS